MSNSPGQIIWQQIPIMTKMAVGARQPMLVDRGIEFRAGQDLRILITLDADDTYHVESYRVQRRTYEKVVVKSFDMVYCDQLSEIVYAVAH